MHLVEMNLAKQSLVGGRRSAWGFGRYRGIAHLHTACDLLSSVAGAALHLLQDRARGVGPVGGCEAIAGYQTWKLSP